MGLALDADTQPVESAVSDPTTLSLDRSTSQEAIRTLRELADDLDLGDRLADWMRCLDTLETILNGRPCLSSSTTR